MIELRPFLNCDSPGIAAVWNAQLPLRGRLPKLTSDVLEQYVLSKPYFDAHDLIVAVEEGRVIGFVHVGFQPAASPGPFDHREGIVCQLQTLPREDSREIASRLLTAGSSRLQAAGARVLLGGGLGVEAPFYLGLYGGSHLPGALIDDAPLHDALRAAEFVKFRAVGIWHRHLAGFRPPIDREVVALRRQFQFHISSDFVAKDWRESCTFSWTEPIQIKVVSAASGNAYAELTFWDCEPLASSWGVRSIGLAGISSYAEKPSSTLIAFFLAETMRQFLSRGIATVEVQAESSDPQLVEACGKLAFREVDRGIQYRKEEEVQ